MQNQNPSFGASDHGFRRGMARELLIHNPDVTDAMEALTLAQELILCSYAWEKSVEDAENEVQLNTATKPQAGNTHVYIQPTD